MFLNLKKSFRPAVLFLLCFFPLSIAAAPDRSHWPAALQNVPLDRLSSGAISLLDRNGDLVRHNPAAGPQPRPETLTAVTLDLRVAPNLRLGDDPPELPPDMRAQAEPHIARSPVDSQTLAAVFQEGRFTDGGAVDCGYSITHDGGLTWSRALIPDLTFTTGGPYFRDTDPVAGFDLSGRIYLCTEGATNNDFTEGVILVSRSTDAGATFDSPVIVHDPADSSIFPDKPWMAINTFSSTAHVGRILVTWTEFGTTSASPIFRSYSDDHGITWSAASPIHPSSTVAQGSQPLFLPDGRVAIIYWNFASSGFGGREATNALEEIDMVISNDGGASYEAPTLVTTVARYNQPSIRSGTFLPSATTDRITGTIYVVYQALSAGGTPRILFTKSINAGATWSAPIAVSDNPGTGVFNPAIACSPDGQTLTVSFYDQRDSGGNTLLCNLYLAQSFDAGATWQPNLRLTSATTDASLAPLTDSGFMIGDYLGIAPTTEPDIPAVPVWIDTRTGNPDPFISRAGIAPEVDFTSFQASRLSLAQIDDPELGGTAGDADGDGENNLSEFLSGTEPNDSISVIHPARQLNISTRESVGTGDNVLIGGFIVTGSASKNVILRAIGPSLGAAGIENALEDPVLELHDQTGALMATNDNWRDTQEIQIEATGIPPTDNRESALVALLTPGEYTAVLSGKSGGTGTALVEVYDLDSTPASQFGNISTRGLVGTGSDVLIGGLIVSSEQSGQSNVIVRGLGPSLAGSGVSGILADPMLEVHDRNGAIIAANDNWQETQGGIISSTGLAPGDPSEAALFVTLTQGEYTAVVQGVNGTTGIGQVEVFNIP